MSDDQKRDRDPSLQDDLKDSLKDVRETINETIRETKESVRDSVQEEKRRMREDRKWERAEEREWRNRNRVSDGLGVGVTFIFIGVVWMLMKMGYLNFSIVGAFIDLWPLIFVVIGINIIFKKIPYVGLLTWTLFLSAIVGYGMYFAPSTYNHGFNIDLGNTFNNQASVNGKVIKDLEYKSINVPMADHKTIKEGVLNLNLGFGNVSIGSTQDDLIAYSTPNAIIDLHETMTSDRASYTFENKKGLNINNFGNVNYDYFLNTDMDWSIDLNMGATDSKLNLDAVKVKRLNINGGAGDFELILGDKAVNTEVSVNVAAGDLVLDLPKDIGVRISSKGLFGDTNFTEQGLTKMGDAYVNEAFSSSDKVINIDVNSAVSSIDVQWH